jgi:hypothetical protein
MEPLFTKKICLVPIIILIFLFMSIASWSQTPERTVGLLINTPAAYDGYNLFYPITNPQYTYLINNAGKVCHTWVHTDANGSKYLLDNGNLLMMGWKDGIYGIDGVVREMDWDGNVVWDFVHPDYSIHHDIRPLPNGNILMVAESIISQTEAIAAGANPANVPAEGFITDNVIEVDPDLYDPNDPGASIVWAWYIMDHVIQDFDATKANFGVICDHPERVDVNFVYDSGSNWTGRVNRFNALDYHPDLDQIIVSASTCNEIWIIDRNTTTEEAAGPAGGLLYRWGNPQVCDAGDPSEQRISFQHNVQWIDDELPGEGNVLIFNNGQHLRYSQVLEIAPVMKGKKKYVMNQAVDIWCYEKPGEFFGRIVSGAQRLPNGNTLIAEGPNGILFEVTPEKEIVWKYRNPVGRGNPWTAVTQGSIPGGFLNGAVFRVTRIETDHPGLAHKDLTPDDPIEGYPTSVGTNIIDETILTNKNHEYLTVNIPTNNDIDLNSILLESSPPIDIEVGSSITTLKFDSKEIFEIVNAYCKRYDEVKLHLTGFCGGASPGWFIGSDVLIYSPGNKTNVASSTLSGYAVLANYPNPFNPETEIRFQLPEASKVKLTIYNSLGQTIRTLTNTYYDAGYHSIRWDGHNEIGSPVSSGVYLYRIQAGTYSQIKKMTLIR